MTGSLHVADRIQAAIDATGSFACVGLDPRPDLVPPPVREAALRRHGDTEEAIAAAFVELNRGIIGAVVGRCAAVKPQSACYEAYGAAGWEALRQTVAEARALGLEVIVDAKRGDVGSTADHYAQAVFGGAPGLGAAVMGGLEADWVTVNNYLGSDSIRPFLGDDHRRGVFVLVRNSNPSAAEVQDAPAADVTVADHVARLVHRWGEGRVGRCGLSDVGAVVGATLPDQARRLREAMPDTLFLVPGYGAQGGDAVAATVGARPDGRGILVSSSRSIAAAWQTTGTETGDWVDACRAELDDMNAALEDALR